MSTYHQLNSFFSKALFKNKKRAHKTRKYLKFNLLFVGTALIPLLSVGLFNLIIDPYGIFNSPVSAGINKAKPDKFNQDLLFKAAEITRLKPEIILLGSSRVQWGLDPTYSGFADSKKVYNLGLQASNMYVVKEYFNHALVNQPHLKKVIIGIDFLMFNDYIKPTAAFDESRLNKKFLPIKDIQNILFSFDSLNISINTLNFNQKNVKKNFIFVSRFMVKDNIFNQGMLVFDESTAIPGSLQNFTRNMARGFRYATPYKLSKNNLEDLKEIVNICQKKGIDLKVFITPSHALDLEAIRARGWWSNLEQWKREISKITPVWDFATYNSITSEPISKDMKYFIDSFHFNQKAGNLILNQLLSAQEKSTPQDFGILITSKNIEAHLFNVRANRQVWATQNPDLVKLVKSIKAEQDKQRKASK